MRGARVPGDLTPDEWFSRRGAFTIRDFLQEHPGQTPRTASSLLRYYVKRGDLVRMKRGLYQEADSIDPVALASRWAPDAVIGYAAAFWLHTAERRRALAPPPVAVLTQTGCAPLKIDGARVVFPVAPAAALGKLWWWEQMTLPWTEGGTVKVTTFERTVVDLLDRQEWCPALTPFWEEIAHRRPNPTRMIDYALKLGNRNACARLGFIAQHLPGATPEDLRRLPRPKSAAYFDERTRTEDRQLFRARWNLMIPSIWLHSVQQTDFYGPEPRFTKIETGPRW